MSSIVHRSHHDRMSQFGNDPSGDGIVRYTDADRLLVGLEDRRNVAVGVQDESIRAGQALFHQPENRIVERSREIGNMREVVTDEGEVPFSFFHPAQSADALEGLVGADVTGQGIQGIGRYYDDSVVAQDIHRFGDVPVVDIVRINA